MSQPSSLWERAKRARIIQVLAVYLGASWVVLQIADILVDALSLPSWVMPVALILLLIGLVVILATAVVQSLPSTTAREEAGELPRDWQIAPRDALSSLRAGRLPHLTWGRSVAGGVVVLSLLFGGAGMYVGLTGSRVSIGPARANASEAAVGIAVVPFEVRGQDLEIWREGMMDLLSSGLDGVGGFRAIDSRTLMARWQAQVGDGRPDLEQTLHVARSVGARFALVGSVVGLGGNVRLVANVYDLDTGREVSTGRVEGPTGDVLRLVDELAVATMRGLLLSVGRQTSGDESAETITTASLPALRAFLEGESHYRKGRFAEAVQSYERAVAEDSTFAIGLVRLSEAYGWLENQNSARMLEVGARAVAQAHRLSPRYQFIMQGWSALNHGNAGGVASLKEAVRKYPDDPQAWFLLAETYIHVGGATYYTDAELWEALERATTLDPNFAPYLVHFAEYATLRGDRQLAESTVERYGAIAGDLNGVAHVKLAIPLLLGTDEEVRTALAQTATVPVPVLDTYLGTFARRHDHFNRDAAVDSIFGARSEQNRVAWQAWHAGTSGQLERGSDYASNPVVSSANRAIYWAHMNELWDTTPPTQPAPGPMSQQACEESSFNHFCLVFVGAALARTQRWVEHGRVVERLRRGAGEARTAGDTALASHLDSDADVVEAAGTWRRGDLHRAREVLTRHASTSGASGDRARVELAWLEVEAGRPTEALRHFRTMLTGFHRPVALYGLARMHEQLGQPAEARGYWASFVTLTKDGDDLPRIREGRETLARSAQERGR